MLAALYTESLTCYKEIIKKFIKKDLLKKWSFLWMVLTVSRLPVALRQLNPIHKKGHIFFKKIVLF